MQLYEGLYVNYNYDGAGYDPDIDLPSIYYHDGFTGIRLLIEQFDYAAGITNWKAILNKARLLPFKEIIFGLSNNAYTSANEAAFNAALLSLATYLQSLNDPRITLVIGNELSYRHDGSVTDAHVRANARTNYTACKAVYTVGKITYNMANGEMFPFYNDFNGSALPYPWDYPSANLYTYRHGATTSGTYFTVNLSSALSWFGPTFTLSEVGPDPEGYSDTYWFDQEFYAKRFARNILAAIEKGIKVICVYNYMDANFGMISPTGIHRAWYYTVLGLPIPNNAGMI